MSFALAATSLESLLHSIGEDSLHSSSSPGAPSYVRTLKHFETITYATMGNPLVQGVVRSANLKYAMTYPYLMQAILALSSTHLKHLHPYSTNPNLHRQHSLAESYHWECALSLFRAEISSPSNLLAQNMDPIITTSMLLSRQSFNSSSPSSSSFVFAPAGPQTATALNWLTVQSGVKSLLIAFQPHIPTSIWFPVFMDSDDREGTFFDEHPGADDLPPAFAALCNITPTSTIRNNPYHAPLRLLAPLLRLEPGLQTFTKLITFMGRIPIEFQHLLKEKDARALLILAYWLALMSRIDQWWIVGRARSECQAICTFLWDKSDERIRGLLRFPMDLVK